MTPYHGRSLRKGRHSESNRIYLVTTVTHLRHPLFRELRIGRLLVAELRLAAEQRMIDSLAWVVMPDHLHWLFALQYATLASVMLQVKSRSAIAINREYGKSGRIWQKGYYDQALRKDEDLVAMARYVVANPLRAGMVKRLGDYPFWDAVWV